MKKDQLTAVLFSFCIIAVLALNVGVYYRLSREGKLSGPGNAEMADTNNTTPRVFVRPAPVIESYYRVFSRMFLQNF